MAFRRSLKLPIVLAVVMIILLVALTVGWVLVTVQAALTTEHFSTGYWALLSIGVTFLVLTLAGVIVYLVLSIKTIRLNQRQSNFIDSVTHELKTPIASLKLYLQTISRRQVKEEERAKFCEIMLEDLDRLDHLINHVLDAGRVDSLHAEGDSQEVDLAALLEMCIDSVCLRYRVSRSVARCDLSPCFVSAPRNVLELILSNVLDNAIKYAGEQPEISVRLFLNEKKHAVIQIGDNGAGIPKKLRRKIFGRFVRLGRELERSRAGTGLGLYIVRNLVRQMRGRISVTDRQPDPGTLFEISLPGVSGEPGSTEPEKPSVALPIEKTVKCLDGNRQ